jgi:hypothetical protein
MTLVAVNVFETDIKLWWCVRISSLLSHYLFNLSLHINYAVCMGGWVCVCVCKREYPCVYKMNF